VEEEIESLKQVQALSEVKAIQSLDRLTNECYVSLQDLYEVPNLDVRDKIL